MKFTNVISRYLYIICVLFSFTSSLRDPNGEYIRSENNVF
jgi:hypothetical protein